MSTFIITLLHIPIAQGYIRHHLCTVNSIHPFWIFWEGLLNLSSWKLKQQAFSLVGPGLWNVIARGSDMSSLLTFKVSPFFNEHLTLSGWFLFYLLVLYATCWWMSPPYIYIYIYFSCIFIILLFTWFVFTPFLYIIQLKVKRYS